MSYSDKERKSFKKGTRVGFIRGVSFQGKLSGYKDAKQIFSPIHELKSMISRLELNNVNIGKSLLAIAKTIRNPNQLNTDMMINSIASAVTAMLMPVIMQDLEDRGALKTHKHHLTTDEQLRIWFGIKRSDLKDKTDPRRFTPAYYEFHGLELPYVINRPWEKDKTVSEENINYIQRELRGDILYGTEMPRDFIEQFVYTGEPDVDIQAVDEAIKEMTRVQKNRRGAI